MEIVKYGLCMFYKLSEEFCKFVKEIYVIDFMLIECKNIGMGDVCKMKIIRISEESEIFFKCN